MFINSLKFKIIIAALAIMSVVMVATTWRDIRVTEQKMLETQKEKAALLSERITHGIMVLMLKNMWQDLQSMMEGLVSDSGELKEIRIFQPDTGTIIVSSKPYEIGKKIYQKDLEVLRSNMGMNAFLIEKRGEEYASKLTEIKNQPVCHQCHSPDKEILGVLDVEVSTSEIYSSIATLKKEHFIDTVIGFVFMGGGFFLIIGLLIDRPITRMVGTIQAIENGDRSVRMEENRRNEFGLVARSFNSMLDSLEVARKEIEHCHAEQMQRAAKLASLGEIISGIAHEIKNPLAGISCAVQVFQSEMSKDDSRRAITKEILNHIKRLDSTVKDLLNYAKPKPPRFFPCRVSDVMDKAVFFVYPEAKKHKVDIETDIQNDLPDVMMDPDQMEQVFLNLMINAVQAMHGGGKFSIAVQEMDTGKIREDIKAQIASEQVLRIEFVDTGKGIASEHMKNIFDPFFTRKAKGTGLGLSISQRIVQEHGGDIVVRSEIGKGSEFIIYLPVVTAKVPA